MGSARSNASAFGMKSNNDQTRITKWLASATSNGPRTCAALHAVTNAAINANSNAVWAGIQNRRREMPPLCG